MLRLNAKAPDFTLQGVESDAVRPYRLAEHETRWVVLFFYPADFTFVCPTEMRGFHERLDAFRELDCAVVAVGVDDLESHRAWARELGGIAFPLLSDPRREVCRAYGVLSDEEDRPWRATFILAPGGRVAWMTVSPMNVGRSVEETLRVLAALQTGRLCPADWQPGEPTVERRASLRY